MPVSAPLSHSLPPGPSGGGFTISEAINDMLIAKARANRGDRYVEKLRYTFKKFSHGRSKMALGAVTAEFIDDFLADHDDLGARTIKGMILDLRALYNFALKRGYVNFNPALAVEIPTQSTAVPGIHTPSEARTYLETAYRMDLNLMRSLAIRYFAGLRACEVQRMEENHIRRSEGLIEVTAITSKGGRRRRLVTIQPVLDAWLELGGEVQVPNYLERMAELVKASGLPWPQNAPRHSFCSYHLAKFENAAKTALEAGHSEQMLFQNYRAVVSKAKGEEFFNLFPQCLVKTS